jgi:hypothetical protein
VRGRVQRRQTALSHPHGAARSSTFTETPAAESPAPTATGWDGFSQALGNDARSMVLESWSLEEPGSPSATSSNSGGGGGQFNDVAQAALDRLNEARQNRGEPPLHQLPPDEEMRIMAQVGGAPGTGHQPPPIRNWDDFGTAVRSDLADEFGGYFGMDGAALTGTGSPALSSTDAAVQAARQPSQEATFHEEPDDEPDLELLTTQLYDRIRSRLRRELLLDRERAGLLSDFR